MAMKLKWGDKDKMICDTCEHVGMGFDADGIGPYPVCKKKCEKFNPWHADRGGRGCPEWEPRISIPADQMEQ
jgi:hypothetical protein